MKKTSFLYKTGFKGDQKTKFRHILQYDGILFAFAV